MRKYSVAYVLDWNIGLLALPFVLRVLKSSDHGYSTFFLVYGRNPRIGFNKEQLNVEKDVEWKEIDLIIARVAEIMAIIDVVIPTALKNIQVDKEKMMNQHNKKTKEKKFFGKKLVPVNSPQTKDSTLSHWQCPYEVAMIIKNNIYKLKYKNLLLNTTYHTNELKLYKKRYRMAIPLKCQDELE